MQIDESFSPHFEVDSNFKPIGEVSLLVFREIIVFSNSALSADDDCPDPWAAYQRRLHVCALMGHVERMGERKATQSK